MAFFGVSVNFVIEKFRPVVIEKLKMKRLACLSFLWWGVFWGNERKYFTHILSLELPSLFSSFLLFPIQQHRLSVCNAKTYLLGEFWWKYVLRIVWVILQFAVEKDIRNGTDFYACLAVCVYWLPCTIDVAFWLSIHYIYWSIEWCCFIKAQPNWIIFFARTETNAINQSFLCNFQSVLLKRIRFEYQKDAKMLSPVEVLTLSYVKCALLSIWLKCSKN